MSTTPSVSHKMRRSGLIGSEKIWDRGAALTSQLQSFETGLLTQEENLAALAAINRELIAKAETIDASHGVVLDMDSTAIPVYGEQEQSAYNGHFESTCYHQLLLFNREGACLVAELRPAISTAPTSGKNCSCRKSSGSRSWARMSCSGLTRPLRSRKFYEAQETRGVKYTIRIAANDSLERDIAELLTRPVGRLSPKPVVWYKRSFYRAAS